MVLLLIVVVFVAWLLLGASHAIINWLFWAVIVLLLIWAIVTIVRMIQNGTSPKL